MESFEKMIKRLENEVGGIREITLHFEKKVGSLNRMFPLLGAKGLPQYGKVLKSLSEYEKALKLNSNPLSQFISSYYHAVEKRIEKLYGEIGKLNRNKQTPKTNRVIKNKSSELKMLQKNSAYVMWNRFCAEGGLSDIQQIKSSSKRLKDMLEKYAPYHLRKTGKKK